MCCGRSTADLAAIRAVAMPHPRRDWASADLKAANELLIDHDDCDADAHYRLARHHAAMGDTLAAEREFTIARDLDPALPIPPTPKGRTTAREESRSHRSRRRLPIAFSDLLTQVCWPEVPAVLSAAPAFADLPRVGTASWGETGFLTIGGNALFYESALERRIIECAHRHVRLIRSQPFRIPNSGYTPDCFLWLEDGRGVVIEVKPIMQMAMVDNLRKAPILGSFAAEHGYGWMVTDGETDLRSVKTRHVPDTFNEALMQRLPLSGADARRLCIRERRLPQDVVTVVLRQRLMMADGSIRKPEADELAPHIS